MASAQLLNHVNKIRETVTLDLPFFFRLKHITSLKNLPSAEPSESFTYWFLDNFVALFCFDLLVERISFVSTH